VECCLHKYIMHFLKVTPLNCAYFSYNSPIALESDMTKVIHIYQQPSTSREGGLELSQPIRNITQIPCSLLNPKELAAVAYSNTLGVHLGNTV